MLILVLQTLLLGRQHSLLVAVPSVREFSVLTSDAPLSFFVVIIEGDVVEAVPRQSHRHVLSKLLNPVFQSFDLLDPTVYLFLAPKGGKACTSLQRLELFRLMLEHVVELVHVLHLKL